MNDYRRQSADKESRTKTPNLNQTEEVENKASPVDDLLNLQRMVGNRGMQSLISGGRLPIQTKLTVGAADDAYEQEADQVAREVVNMPDASVQRDELTDDDEKAISMKRIQRDELPADEDDQTVELKRIQRDELPDDEKALQAKSDSTPEVTNDTENQIESMRGGGQALPDSAREFLEPRFGQDFSSVNVHTGAEADSLNRSLDARAFATGNDIFFRSGEYNPDTSDGRELLAHELTHVVQQGASKPLERKPEDE